MDVAGEAGVIARQAQQKGRVAAGGGAPGRHAIRVDLMLVRVRAQVADGALHILQEGGEGMPVLGGPVGDRRHHIARHGELADVGQVIVDVGEGPAAALDEDDQGIAAVGVFAVLPGLDEAHGDVLAVLVGKDDIGGGLRHAVQHRVEGDGLDGLHVVLLSAVV